MKTLILTITLTAITVAAQSDRRIAIDSFKKPIQRQISVDQFRSTCLESATNTHAMLDGSLIPIKKYALLPDGPKALPTSFVPELKEYKVILAVDDFLYLSTPASNPVPSAFTKLAEKAKGDVFNARLFDSGQQYTAKFAVGGKPIELTMAVVLPWDPKVPSEVELITAFENGTPFDVVLESGTEKLSTLYTVTIK